MQIAVFSNFLKIICSISMDEPILCLQPFTKKDIIHIQDPRNVAVRVLDNFDHVKKGLDARDDAAQEHNVNLAGVSDDMRRTLAAIGAQTEAKPVSAQEKKAAAKVRRFGIAIMDRPPSKPTASPITHRCSHQNSRRPSRSRPRVAWTLDAALPRDTYREHWRRPRRV